MLKAMNINKHTLSHLFQLIIYSIMHLLIILLIYKLMVSFRLESYTAQMNIFLYLS